MTGALVETGFDWGVVLLLGIAFFACGWWVWTGRRIDRQVAENERDLTRPTNERTTK